MNPLYIIYIKNFFKVTFVYQIREGRERVLCIRIRRRSKLNIKL
jgi:hypothetical protein